MDDENMQDSPQQQLRLENEILKIKLKAQYGDGFIMETNEGMPPEIENQFLKSILAFEDNYNPDAYTTVYERIGKPELRSRDNMNDDELAAAIVRLNYLLDKHYIQFSISDGPYPDERIYTFMTEELMGKRVERMVVPGMYQMFVYEEFYPNHKAEIIKRTNTFFANWFDRKFNEYCTELSWHCISFDGVHFSREDVVDKINIFFHAFEDFSNAAFKIMNTSFEMEAGTQRAMGFAEGAVRYDAIIDNKEKITYNGPFKLYMSYEENWWSIFYFVVPGFQW